MTTNFLHMTTNQEPPPIKAGDLLYAVGPGHNPPLGGTDLQVYCTPVVASRRLSSYNILELGHDRPVLGFPRYLYGAHEIGIHIHRSRSAALQAFKEQAHQSLSAAQDALAAAYAKIQWTLTTDEEHPAPSQQRPANHDGWCLAAETPHTFMPGQFRKGDRSGQWPEETCKVCGMDPRNSGHKV